MHAPFFQLCVDCIMPDKIPSAKMAFKSIPFSEICIASVEAFLTLILIVNPGLLAFSQSLYFLTFLQYLDWFCVIKTKALYKIYQKWLVLWL